MPHETPEPARRNSDDSLARELERVDKLDSRIPDRRYERNERKGLNLLDFGYGIAEGIDRLRISAQKRRGKDAAGAEKLEATASRIEAELIALLQSIDRDTVESILDRFATLGSQIPLESAQPANSRMPKDPRKRLGAFAERPNETEEQSVFKQYSAAEKRKMLEVAAASREALPKQVQYRMQQLEIFRTIFDETLLQIEDPKTRAGKGVQWGQRLGIPKWQAPRT